MGKFFAAFIIFVQFQHRSKQGILPSKTVLSEKTAIRRMYQLQVRDQICVYGGTGSRMRRLIYKIRPEKAVNRLKLMGHIIKQ